MADADLQVVFTADASGVTRGAAEVNAAVQSLSPAIDTARGAFDTFRKTLEAAFKPASADNLKVSLGQVVAIARAAESEKLADIKAELAAQKEALQEQIKAAQQAYGRSASDRRAEHDAIIKLIGDEKSAEIKAAQETLAARLAMDSMIKSVHGAETLEYLKALADENKAYDAFLDAKVKADAQANAQINKQRATEVASFQRDWSGVMNPMVHSFTAGIEAMALRTKTFRQVMLGLGQQILTDFVTKLINPMIERWLWKELGQTAATLIGVKTRTTAQTVGAAQGMAIDGATAIKSVVNDAAKAFSGAYSALVGIPIIGPEIAPPAAAAASGAVLAVQGTIASASGGYDIPRGLNPLTQLHQQEMVLPARLANPMRALLSGYAGAKAPANAEGGDTHVHLNVSALDGPGVQQFFDTHGDKLFKTLNGKLRGGAKLAVA